MPDIEIYCTSWCPYCTRAKSLLDRKGLTYKEIDVGAAPERRDEMRKRADGRNTVPQIFINGTHVGGCDDLFALDRQGGLAPLLEA